MEAVNRKMHLTKEEKEELSAEMTRKRKFVGEIKELIDGTNFSVGTEDPNFDRKEGATIDDPNYNMTVVSPWPHKNTSTLKVKYVDSSVNYLQIFSFQDMNCIFFIYCIYQFQ